MTPEPPEPSATSGRWRTSLLVPLAIVLVVGGILAGIVFVARQEHDSGVAVLAGGSVDVTTLPVTVPYREVAGAIVIDVTLGEGSRTVPMILDTGAPTIISEPVAEAFAGDAAGTVSSTSVDGQVFSNEVVVLPQLAIGGAVFSDVGAVVDQLEPGNPFYCLSEAGFIGASLMRTAVWQIDPQDGVVRIARSTDGLDHVDAAIGLAFTPASDLSPSPLLELPVGDGRLTVLLDSGSDGWLAANPADLAELGVTIPEDAPSMAILGTTATASAVTRASWVEAGPGGGGLPVAAMELLPPGQANAGTDYLSRFVVTIDWPAGMVYLDPIEAVTPSIPASATLAWDDGFVIGSYVDGLPANAGLGLSDEVLDIDGEDVTGATFDTFCRHLTGTPASYEMTVAGEPPARFQVAPVEGFHVPPGR